jgi:hypothetical protein
MKKTEVNEQPCGTAPLSYLLFLELKKCTYQAVQFVCTFKTNKLHLFSERMFGKDWRELLGME